MTDKIRKLMASVLAIVCAVGFGSCSGKETEPVPPDYSDSERQMRLYAYYGPTDGTWRQQGKQYSADQDFRTVERYKEYLDAGLNAFMMGGQDSAVYHYGIDWETSDAKMIMDRAYEAGIQEIFVMDSRLRGISATSGGVVGPGKMFETEADLDAEITKCMAAYRDHPAFYGVLLHDEPQYTQLKSVGEVYRSVKRVCPEAKAHCNLWPPAESSIGTWLPAGDDPDNPYDLETAWKAYLRMFVEETGADYVQYDHYPFQPNEISAGYIRGMQMTAEVAAEMDVDFYQTTQTFAMYSNGDLYNRQMTADDAYFLQNLSLGFGVKEIAYYSYWTYANNPPGETYCIDGASFVTHMGVKTDMYYFMQQINKEIQKFAPVIMNFDYQASTYFAKPPVNYNNSHVTHPGAYGMEKNDLEKVMSVLPDKETVLVTELKDESKGNYMYMVLNIVDPSKAEGSSADISAEVTFSDEYTHVAVYEKGERTLHKLSDGKYTVTVKPGHAQYLLPY